jgi:hypothetical protein
VDFRAVGRPLEPIKKKVGKKKETVGFNYCARAAAILCHGPAC